MGQTYLWRGWMRLALEELEIARTLDPADISASIAYAYALNENDRGEEARSLARELLAKYPKNSHVQRLNEYFKIGDLPLVSFDSNYFKEFSGVREYSWTSTVEQPIFPWRKIFAGFLRQDTAETDLKDKIRRSFV
jgi:hypothetical protein